MTIKSFEYEDRQRGWKLERTEFGSFNLLVGLSGVGKTSIIRALQEVRAAGLSQRGSWGSTGDCRWCITLASGEETYRWDVETKSIDGVSPGSEDNESLGDVAVRIERERITTEDGTVLVDRSPDGFTFQGNKLPKLKDTESAISLLKAEDSIAPLYRTLRNIIVGDAAHRMVVGSIASRKTVQAETSDTLDSLRERLELPTLLKAYIAGHSHKESFARIKTQYCDIFPNITDVCIDSLQALDPTEARRAEIHPELEAITVAIKEAGIDRWIFPTHMSSGMLRTFFHLAELELAPSGAAIVIDEYENSMGINCLPAMTEHFLARQGDLQFILTSHHPYVINNIPVDWWRVVTRHGGSVRVHNARDIPALNTSSRQAAFTLLTSSDVYQEGIQ